MERLRFEAAKPFKSLKSILYFAHGAVAGALFWTSPLLAIFLYALFFTYEYVEEAKLRDEMYAELAEWTLGFTAAVVLARML